MGADEAMIVQISIRFYEATRVAAVRRLLAGGHGKREMQKS